MANTGVNLPPDVLKDPPEAAIRRLYSYLYEMAEDINTALHIVDMGAFNQASDTLAQINKAAAQARNASASSVSKLSRELSSMVDALHDYTDTTLAAAIEAVQDAMYPVGSIFLSTQPTPPSFGTWVRQNSGYFIVTGDPDTTPSAIRFASDGAGDTTISRMNVIAYKRTA